MRLIHLNYLSFNNWHGQRQQHYTHQSTSSAEKLSLECAWNNIPITEITTTVIKVILHGTIRNEDFSSTQRCKLAVYPSLRRCYTGRFSTKLLSAPQLCEIRWKRTCYTGRFFWRNKKNKGSSQKALRGSRPFSAFIFCFPKSDMLAVFSS